MNQKPKLNEDFFLKARVADRRTVSCFLGSGTRLQGTIVAFDQEAIFMRPIGSEDDADIMMIYKLQVASVTPDPAKKAWRMRPQAERESAAGRAVAERRADQAQ
ncbi:MAG TPA: RNA chaperone Hfq [Steroidobacteraceae bacterium]|nr:RNA chaperone Hfq [Steroidobacteraceae bacterium]